MAESSPTNPSYTVGSIPLDVFSATYAVLVASGGILGYVKAKSIPSLVAGLSFGLLLGVGSYLEASQDNYWVTYGGSGVLALMMGPRFLRSRKFMPSGLVTALSVAMITRYTVRTIQIQTSKH